MLSAFIRYDGHEAGRLMATYGQQQQQQQQRQQQGGGGHGQPRQGGDGGQQQQGGASSTSAAADDLVADLDGFCAKIQTVVELIRISPTLIDQIGACLSIICEAACEHKVRMQGGFMTIALTMKVVEGSIIQVDPHTKVAPRAKPVVVRESARRKAKALLHRTLGTAEPEDPIDAAARAAAEAKLIAEAKARAVERGRFDLMDEYRNIRRRNLERSSLAEKVASVDQGGG